MEVSSPMRTIESSLEPGAETSEQILISLGDARVARVEASYVARVATASSLKALVTVPLVWLGSRIGIEPSSNYIDPRIRIFNSRIILDMESIPTTLAPGDTGN
jgi:hypothetical protein